MPTDPLSVLLELVKLQTEDLRSLRATCEGQAERLGQLATEIAAMRGSLSATPALEKRVEEIEKALGELNTAKDQVLGGWKALGIAASVGASVSGVIIWAKDHVKF